MTKMSGCVSGKVYIKRRLWPDVLRFLMIRTRSPLLLNLTHRPVLCWTQNMEKGFHMHPSTFKCTDHLHLPIHNLMLACQWAQADMPLTFNITCEGIKAYNKCILIWMGTCRKFTQERVFLCLSFKNKSIPRGCQARIQLVCQQGKHLQNRFLTTTGHSSVLHWKWFLRGAMYTWKHPLKRKKTRIVLLLTFGEVSCSLSTLFRNGMFENNQKLLKNWRWGVTLLCPSRPSMLKNETSRPALYNGAISGCELGQ